VKYVDEYRDEAPLRQVLDRIHQDTHGSWTLMELCGGQTHTLVRSGIDRLLPKSVEMVHGPGCPVCVTPLELIDRALAIARRSATCSECRVPRPICWR
jgi:hydrogenase expression/formation protein HypD